MNEYESRYKNDEDEDEGIGLLGPLAAVAAFPAARRLSTPFGKALVEKSALAKKTGEVLSNAGRKVGEGFDNVVGQSDTLSLLQTAGRMGQERVASDLPITGKLGDFSNWKTALKQAGNDYAQLYGGVVDTARAIPYAREAQKFAPHIPTAKDVAATEKAVKSLKESPIGKDFSKLYGDELLGTVAQLANIHGIKPEAAMYKVLDNIRKYGDVAATRDLNSLMRGTGAPEKVGSKTKIGRPDPVWPPKKA